MIIHRFTAAQVGLNSTTLPAVTGSLNSTILPCSQCSAVSVWVNYTYAAATNVQYQLVFYSQYISGAANATYTVGTNDYQAVSENIVTGTGTLSLYNQIIAVSASGRWVDTFPVPVGADAWQLKNIFGTSSTTDSLTVIATIAQIGSRT